MGLETATTKGEVAILQTITLKSADVGVLIGSRLGQIVLFRPVEGESFAIRAISLLDESDAYDDERSGMSLVGDEVLDLELQIPQGGLVKAWGEKVIAPPSGKLSGTNYTRIAATRDGVEISEVRERGSLSVTLSNEKGIFDFIKIHREALEKIGLTIMDEPSDESGSEAKEGANM